MKVKGCNRSLLSVCLIRIKTEMVTGCVFVAGLFYFNKRSPWSNNYIPVPKKEDKLKKEYPPSYLRILEELGKCFV